MTSGADLDPAALDVATAYLDALGGDDPSAVSELVSDDFRNQHHSMLGAPCVGRDEYARRLPGFFATFADRRYDVSETVVGVAVGPSAEAAQSVAEVVVNYRFHADVDGTHIDIPGVMWITVHDGLVTRRLDSWDSGIFHQQMAADDG